MFGVHYSVTSLLVIFLNCYFICFCEEYCSKDECDGGKKYFKPRYLFYDVNFPEGFNLRRDVYMRLAIFMHSLKSSGHDWHLVLPPWHHLYHWKSTDVGEQSQLPWSMFFDVESMQRFSPVIELHKFLEEVRNSTIEKIYYLHHYKDAFESENWDWKDRWEFSECEERIVCGKENCAGSHYTFKKNSYHGWFWGFKNISGLSVQCVSFQGSASLLRGLLEKDSSLSSIMVDHAEVVLHDTFGDSLYWKCRRSMRFSKVLDKEAGTFCSKFLHCNHTHDGTARPVKWENEKMQRKAKGGPYVCAHLRRGDFLFGRSDQVPNIEYAADQMKKILNSKKLDTVFISTDAKVKEVEDLEKYLTPFKLVQYKPSLETRMQLKDGGVAIVDQIICSYSRYFIGTHESTFTYRIQEEREIIGFPTETTFNVFCANSKKCFETSRWTIVY